MDYLPKELFFAVWDLPELREIICSFMWPGRRSATWYKYRDVQAAVNNGYVELYKYLINTNTTIEPICAKRCIKRGHLSMLKHADDNWDNMYYAMHWAAQYGKLEILIWLHEDKGMKCSSDIIIPAMKNGHTAVADWLCSKGLSSYSVYHVSRIKPLPPVSRIMLLQRVGPYVSGNHTPCRRLFE